MLRTKLFVDFWNFQLDWNRVLGKDANGYPYPIPWKEELPKVLVAAVSRKSEAAKYSGTHVYASVDPNGDEGLRRFLHAMNSFPGYSVVVKQRKASQKPMYCPECRKDVPIRRTVEKGVDTTLAIEMIQMAFDAVYDVAILASTDADLCPAVSYIYQRTGRPVYNLWFPDTGHDLRNACYDHLPMNTIIPELVPGIQLPEATARRKPQATD